MLAFATLTALETSLMPEQKFDFSEDNMIYNNALSDDIQDGGEYIRAMAYLMSWKGPVLEKDVHMEMEKQIKILSL